MSTYSMSDHEMSEREYRKREKIWEEIFEKSESDAPANCGFVFDFFPLNFDTLYEVMESLK